MEWVIGLMVADFILSVCVLGEIAGISTEMEEEKRRRRRFMSAYSDWKCGALNDEEYQAIIAFEAAQDKAAEKREECSLQN